MTDDDAQAQLEEQLLPLLDLQLQVGLEGDVHRFQLHVEPVEAIAPELVGKWGIDYERLPVALLAIAHRLLEQLQLERRRSDQLDRRTRWLYKEVTGQELPEEGTTT